MTKKKNIIPKGTEIDLTIKQAKWLKAYMKLGNATEAAMRVYNCKNRAVANAIGAENLSKLSDPIKMLMEHRGLGVDRFLKVLDGGLKANKVVSAVNTNKDAGASSTDFLDLPDWRVRHLYMTSGAKWLGLESRKPEGVSINRSQFNFFQEKPSVRADFNKKFNIFVRKQQMSAVDVTPDEEEGYTR